MSDGERCRQCGAPLPAVLGTLCPACLLELGDAERAAAGTLVREQLLTHLSIVTLLGEGPRARAYLAEWTTPGAGFAVVKRLKSGLTCASAPQSVVDRLLLLDHPNVAPLLEASLDADGQPYTICEYVPGVPITRFCDRGHLPVKARMELLLQAADALQYAHLLGIAHLNLKPSNLLVLPGQAPLLKVLDFEAGMPLVRVSLRLDRHAIGQDVKALGSLLLDLLKGVSEPLAERLPDVARLASTDTRERCGTVGAFSAAIRAALNPAAVQ